MLQARNKVNVIRHHNSSIKKNFSLVFEPVQTLKNYLYGFCLIKDRLSFMNCCCNKIVLAFDGCSTFA